MAAVALPNLLGQVGKARESEAKTALGALNRAQQAYRLETQKFYVATGDNAVEEWENTQNALGVTPGAEFYTYENTTATASEAERATFTADGIDPANSGVRDFGSGVAYESGAFSTTLCIADTKDTEGGTPSATMEFTAAEVDGDGNITTPASFECIEGSSEIK